MNAEWRERYERAIDFTRKAGKVALRYFDTDLKVETKGDDSPVTVADRETEQSLRSQIHEAFPGDGFLGEEFGDTPGSSGYRWILDPIDGTRSFIRGIPLWGVLVGLEYRGELIAGVMDGPPLGKTYHALRGHGAYRDDRRIRVSDQADLKKAMMLYSGINWFTQAGRMGAYLELVARTERQRGLGDWYGFALVAQGAAELMVDYGVHVWDVAAARPIVEEAGGRFSNWDDGAVDIHRPDVMVSNGKLHDEVLRVLASNGKGH